MEKSKFLLSFLPSFTKLALMIVVAFCKSGCENGTQHSANGDTAVVEVASVDLRPQDEIRSVDFALDRDGVIHVVWNAAIERIPGALPEYATLYSQGGLRGTQWTSAVKIEAAMGVPRLLVARESLHLITGLRLRHYVSDDGGKHWQDKGELLPGNFPHVAGFDVALVNDTLLIACMVHPNTSYEIAARGPEHHQQLILISRTPDGQVNSRMLARFPASLVDPPAPRLLLTNDSQLDLA